MNLPPKNDYETILLTNFSEIYKNIAILNKKISKLESKNKILQEKLQAHNYNRKYRSYLRGHEPKPLPLVPGTPKSPDSSRNRTNPMSKPSRQTSFRSVSLNNLSMEEYAIPAPLLGSQPHNLQAIAYTQQPLHQTTESQQKSNKSIKRGYFL